MDKADINDAADMDVAVGTADAVIIQNHLKRCRKRLLTI